MFSDLYFLFEGGDASTGNAQVKLNASNIVKYGGYVYSSLAKKRKHGGLPEPLHYIVLTDLFIAKNEDKDGCLHESVLETALNMSSEHVGKLVAGSTLVVSINFVINSVVMHSLQSPELYTVKIRERHEGGSKISAIDVDNNDNVGDNKKARSISSSSSQNMYSTICRRDAVDNDNEYISLLPYIAASSFIDTPVGKGLITHWPFYYEYINKAGNLACKFSIAPCRWCPSQSPNQRLIDVMSLCQKLTYLKHGVSRAQDVRHTMYTKSTVVDRWVGIVKALPRAIQHYDMESIQSHPWCAHKFVIFVTQALNWIDNYDADPSRGIEYMPDRMKVFFEGENKHLPHLLDLNKLFYVGPSTARDMYEMGIHNVKMAKFLLLPKKNNRTSGNDKTSARDISHHELKVTDLDIDVDDIGLSEIEYQHCMSLLATPSQELLKIQQNFIEAKECLIQYISALKDLKGAASSSSSSAPLSATSATSATVDWWSRDPSDPRFSLSTKWVKQYLGLLYCDDLESYMPSSLMTSIRNDVKRVLDDIVKSGVIDAARLHGNSGIEANTSDYFVKCELVGGARRGQSRGHDCDILIGVDTYTDEWRRKQFDGDPEKYLSTYLTEPYSYKDYIHMVDMLINRLREEGYLVLPLMTGLDIDKVNAVRRSEKIGLMSKILANQDDEEGEDAMGRSTAMSTEEAHTGTNRTQKMRHLVLTDCNYDRRQSSYEVFVILKPPGESRWRRVDFVCYPASLYAFGQLCWTGSVRLEKDLRIWAERYGYSLDNSWLRLVMCGKSLYAPNNRRAVCPPPGGFETERDILNYLGLPWIPPTMRNS